MNARAEAATILNKVVNEGRSLSDLLKSGSKDHAFIQAVCFGVCRHYQRLDALARALLSKPLKEKDQDIYQLILVGLYQLSDMRVPEHAAVAETVNAVKVFKKLWAKGLVNAVLRSYQRQAKELNQKIAHNIEAKFSHPAWMIGKLQKNWPNDWEAVLTANNQHPPFSLRVNQQKNGRIDYLKKLDGNEVNEIPETRAGITLAQPVDVHELPGFSEGCVSVQDGAAQLAAELLAPMAGERILDACAAPGGKTAHLLEIEPKLAKLVAIDQDPKRLLSVEDNLKRLQLKAECKAADAGAPETWWDGALFDRILLDAPCSASGVIRRHPDIKLLREPEDIKNLAKEQTRLLDALWPLLKPEGTLLYATCSVFSEENTQVLQTFLLAHSDAKEVKIEAPWGKECIVGRQILPGMHGMDGFYFALLRKANAH